MTSLPEITDAHALALHRARADADATFLHETAADEIQDRLKLVNKSFKRIALVTDHADFWQQIFPQAQCFEMTEVLPFETAHFDLILHVMALHWANDPVGQLIQCRRALMPDGLFLSVSFGGETLHELRACLGQAEAAVTGGMSPRVAPMADLRDMGGLLQRGGFALPVADGMPLQVSYRDAWHLMHDLRAMGENNALSARLRRPTRRDVLRHAADLYQAHFSAEDGRVLATYDLIFLTGWAPDDSQQKPLRPGSAQQRLADALGTGETKLPN